MTTDILSYIDNWFDKNSIALELEGTVNIETATIAIASSRFHECDCDPFDNPDYVCKCGRTINNVISMRCGNGDGLYAVMTLKDHTKVKIQKKTARTSRSIGYLIDCDSQHEQTYYQEADWDKAALLDGLSISKSLIDTESNLYHFGTIFNMDGIFISDNQAHIDSSYATISSGDELLGNFSIFAICTEEVRDPLNMLPRLPELKDYENIIVPRLIIIVHQNYAGELLKVSDKLPLSHGELRDSWINSSVQMHSQDASNTAIWNNATLKKGIGRFGTNATESESPSWVLQGSKYYDEEFSEWWKGISRTLTSWAAQGDDPDLLIKNVLINIHNDRAMYKESELISNEFIARHIRTESGAIKINDLCFSVYFPQNKLDEAKKLLLELLSWPNLTQRIIGITQGNLGIIEYKLKNYSKAREFFNMSLIANSTDREALYYLGCISAHENDLVLANSFWNKCLGQRGNYPELAVLKLAGEQATIIPEFVRLARTIEFKDDEEISVQPAEHKVTKSKPVKIKNPYAEDWTDVVFAIGMSLIIGLVVIAYFSS